MTSRDPSHHLRRNTLIPWVSEATRKSDLKQNYFWTAQGEASCLEGVSSAGPNEMQRLILYAEKRDLLNPADTIPLLYPYWGYAPEADGKPGHDRFRNYADNGGDVFQITDDPAKADFLLCPTAFEKPGGKEAAARLEQLAERVGKKFILFFNSDSDEDLPFRNAVVFRTSFYRSAARPREYSLPGWSEDFLKCYFEGKIPLQKKGARPTVGYCGYTGGLLKSLKLRFNYLRGKLLIHRFYDFQNLRGKAVHNLLKSPSVDCHFIIRKKFWGGTSNGAALRAEFVSNLAESAYALVTRGMGNFSYRVYEAMSLGRIPVFIDTDAPLPYEEFVDYRNLFVWISDKDVADISLVLARFHERMTDDQFIARQKEIRAIYEEWIEPLGFHRNLYRILEKNRQDSSL